MTADKIFDSVIALMFGDADDKPDYEERFLSLLNQKLADLFNLNNGYRDRKGMTKLTEPPNITDLEQDPGYEWEVEREVLPLGIAATLYADDDETGISNVYREQYEQKLYENQYARFESAEENGRWW